MTKEARPLTQEQRKEFVQLLKEATTRVLGNLQENWYKRREKARDVVREDLLKRIGALELANKRRDAKKVIKESETALEKLGVDFGSDDRVRFSDSVSEKYGGEIDDKVTEVLEGQKEQSRKMYETAILEVLATESVEEAKGIVQPLV